MPAVPASRIDRRAWAMLAVLCGAVFLEGIDVSMLAVALPSIRTDLGMSTEALWVISAYVLGYGRFVLLGERAADQLGRRRMFLVWLGVFLVFSGLGGLATEAWMLIVARFLTGDSAAFMTPAALSLITASFRRGPARNQALLVYAGGFTLGLVLGGALSALDWRWVFFTPLLVAAGLLAAALRLMPETSPTGPRAAASTSLARSPSRGQCSCWSSRSSARPRPPGR